MLALGHHGTDQPGRRGTEQCLLQCGSSSAGHLRLRRRGERHNGRRVRWRLPMPKRRDDPVRWAQCHLPVRRCSYPRYLRAVPPQRVCALQVQSHARPLPASTTAPSHHAAAPASAAPLAATPQQTAGAAPAPPAVQPLVPRVVYPLRPAHVLPLRRMPQLDGPRRPCPDQLYHRRGGNGDARGGRTLSHDTAAK